MVALVGLGIATLASGGVLGPAFVAGAQAGASFGVGAGVTGAGAVASGAAVTTAVTGAAAVGGAGGAILGGSAAAGAGATTILASAGGAATGAAAGGGISAVTAGVLTGPVGWCVLGIAAKQKEELSSSGVYTFDCWKQILHDDSNEPSSGKILKEIVMDPRIKKIIATMNEFNHDLPNLILENVWDEQFRIDYVFLPSFNQLAAHAVKI